MISIGKEIYKFAQRISNIVKVSLFPHRTKLTILESVGLISTEEPLEMLSSYIRAEVVSKLKIRTQSSSLLVTAKTTDIEYLILKYYNKTIALPFSRLDIRLKSHDIAQYLKKVYDLNGEGETLKAASIIALKLGVTQPTKLKEKIFKPSYWQANITKIVRKYEENMAHELNLKKVGYCSVSAQARYSAELMAKKSYINTLKQGSTQDQAKAHAAENKQYHYQTLVTTKIRGLINLKQQLGLKAIMLTITCPSEVRKNKNLEECIQYLARINKKLTSFRSNHNLGLSGLTSFEPHSDGYPHLHTYIVGSPDNLSLFIEYANTVIGTKNSLSINITWENSNISDLGFYVAKHTLHPNFELDTWFNTLDLRRLSFFGLPSDAVWNTLRKESLSTSFRNKKLRLAQVATKNGDYALFCTLVGGLAIRRKERPYQIIYQNKVDAFHNFVKRKSGVKIFNTYIPITGTVKAISNIVKTKYSRSINKLHSVLKYFGAVGLRSPPRQTPATQQVKAINKRLKN